MMLRKKSRRSSRGHGPASKRPAREKLQQATIVAPSAINQELQRAIAPPGSPPSQRAIAPGPQLQQAIAPFAFSIPSFASAAAGDASITPEQLIEESSKFSVYLEAHAAAHKEFARVLQSKVVMDVEERTAPLPCSKSIGSHPVASLPKLNYPRESIQSVAERHELCNDARCRPFLIESISNLCFFFEEPTDTFDAANSSSQLDKLGPFSNERWRSGHIKCIHCILPNSDCEQAYIVRTGDSTHYQGLFQDFVRALESSGPGFTSVKIYYPGRDYSNQFLVLHNMEHSVAQFRSMVDWPTVRVCIKTLKSSLNTTTTTSSVSRQTSTHFADFGYTSSMCTSRQKSATGVSKPRMKPGTSDPDVIGCFRALSSIVKNAKIPWLEHPGFEAYVDADYPERHGIFAGIIDSQNVLEAVRLNVTDLNNKCGAHSDKLNSPQASLSMVVGLSKIVGTKRIAMNGYSRRAGDSYLKERSRIKPLVDHLLEVYSSTPYNQQVLSPHTLFEGKEVPGIPGNPVIASHCNMDPVSFHNQFLFHILVLAERFSLTLPECIGLQTAYEVFPNTSYYFGLAACSLLQAGSRHPLPTKLRGFGFGLAVANLMNEFYTIATKLKPGQRPGRRFSVYNNAVLQEREDWNKRCHHKMVTCLHVHHLYSVVKSRKERAKVYKTILCRLSGQAPMVGQLIMNHSMALMAQIGLLPAWIREEAVVCPESKYMRYFCGKYDVDKSYLLAGCEKFILTVQAAFNSRFPSRNNFTVREIENILCKVFRLDNLSDHRWCDLLFPLQNVFSFQGENILIYSPNQDRPQEIQGYLINHWPYGDTAMDMEEMVRSMNLGSIMPTDKSTAEFVVPRQLLFPRAKMQLDFRLDEVKRENKAALALSESVFKKVL